jgi:hypothetical protein
MKGKVLAALLVAATTTIGSQASAAIVDYYISGDGSGVLNGINWSGPFKITMVGDIRPCRPALATKSSILS